MTNSQESFWTDQIESSYALDNSKFDMNLGCKAWRVMLESINLNSINGFLDCGSNIGRNVGFLNCVIPEASSNIIELAPKPFSLCTSSYKIDNSYLGAIKNATFDTRFDLVFSCGVLIHVNPDDLLASMERMYNLSSRYILIAEYFNRTPVSIDYRGSTEKLFKLDFGKLFLENFDCVTLDYGFLWGVEYEPAGFDDVTFWLFEKASTLS